jgi:hypothetical protein
MPMSAPTTPSAAASAMTKPTSRPRASPRRENEHAAGEQRDEREHVEIHAIRARQPRGGRHAGLRRCCDKSGRQQCLHALRERSDVGARRCAQVDARQPAAQSERILDGSDVHHRVTQRPAATRHTGDAQRQRCAARCDVDGVAIVNAQPACCGRAGKQRVASQRIHPVPRCADERRRDRSRAKHVDAYERQRRVATAHRDIGFDDGARDGDAVELREQRIECLVEAGARPAHLDICISGKRRKSRRKLVHRGTIDELDGVAERDTERDRNDGEQRAPADERAHAARDGACDG